MDDNDTSASKAQPPVAFGNPQVLCRGLRQTPYKQTMDALSEILKSMTIVHASVGTLTLSEPWGMALRGFEPHIAYGVVSGSACWVRVPHRDPICLGIGDVMLIRGEHQLLSSPDTLIEDFGAAWAANGFPEFEPSHEPAAPLHFSWGGGGPRTLLLGLAFGLSGGPHNPLMTALPPCIVLRSGQGFPWIRPAIEFLTGPDSTSPGYAATARLLAELTFVSIVRSHLLSESNSARGWLRGLTHPGIAKALQAMHQAPGESWTVASLATRADMSRTSFAKVFSDHVQLTPIDYLTQWRMHLAAQRILESPINLTQLAFELGYNSDAAFRDAFKRRYGVPPSRFGSHAQDTGAL
jgi:AraC-like DNA-binding protein